MQKLDTDILVVGGGASGVCAAIQAARLGTQVILVEETPWLGGMLTAAGVSAIDGNHQLPSGLWGEFRQALYDYYGGPEAVATGWVSHTLFEPQVGNRILQAMVRAQKNITVYHGFAISQVLKRDNCVTGAVFTSPDGAELLINTKITIEATEYGDVLPLAGCDYRIGREARSETGERFAPDSADDIIQDITYVAILKDYGPDADMTIPEPPDYNPAEFDGTCRELSDQPDDKLVDARTMLNYGRLPNNKFMVNWPLHGNDYYLNLLEMSQPQRQAALQKAKNHTLGWIHFIQTQGGFRNLGLADDEFPTRDRLALIPYIRESRRVIGLYCLALPDLENFYHSPNGSFYQAGIAVGDYPLDHHHQKSPIPVNEQYPSVWAFTVPYGCLVPKNIDGLLAAEKSISVTHYVNGCTRLQPVVMEVGQAAGAAAAICVHEQLQPREIAVRRLQQVLLDAGAYLMPFADVTPTDPDFQTLQRIGVTGLIKGTRLTREWVNEMRLYPDNQVTESEIETMYTTLIQKGCSLPRTELLNAIRGITRRQLACWLENNLDPFWKLPLD